MQLRHEIRVHSGEGLGVGPPLTGLVQQGVNFGRCKAGRDDVGLGRPVVHTALDEMAIYAGREKESAEKVATSMRRRPFRFQGFRHRGVVEQFPDPCDRPVPRMPESAH